MPTAFQTEDGLFHQAVVAVGRNVLLRVSVERLVAATCLPTAWEWRVWEVASVPRVLGADWRGVTSSLETAKLAALDRAIVRLGSADVALRTRSPRVRRA